MSVASQPHKFTYDDYCKLPDEPRMELIEGSFLVSPAPNTSHQRVLGRLHKALSVWVDEHALGEVFIAPCDVVLSRHNVVQPDLLFVSTQQTEIITKANIQGSPDLVVEIISPSNSTRDTLLKKALYEKFGVCEYWIVDPEEKIITQMLLESGHYMLKRVHDINNVLECKSISNFKLSLAQIFKEPV